MLLALSGVAPFEFGVICELFGIDRFDEEGASFNFIIATAAAGRRPSAGSHCSRLTLQSIIRAQLEQSDFSLETVAAFTGSGVGAETHRYFVKVLQTDPTTYRRAFCPRPRGAPFPPPLCQRSIQDAGTKKSVPS